MSVEWHGSLPDLFRTDAVKPLLHGIAAREGRRLHERAAELTPKRTGATASAWERMPVTPTADGGFASGTANRNFRARLLENGWAAHSVKPKRRGAKALDTPEGPRAHAEVPAFGGAHMTAKAAAYVEATWAARAEPGVRAWGERLERDAGSGREVR